MLLFTETKEVKMGKKNSLYFIPHFIFSTHFIFSYHFVSLHYRFVSITPNFPAKVIPVHLPSIGGKFIAKKGTIQIPTSTYI